MSDKQLDEQSKKIEIVVKSLEKLVELDAVKTKQIEKLEQKYDDLKADFKAQNVVMNQAISQLRLQVSELKFAVHAEQEAHEYMDANKHYDPNLDG